MRPFIEKPIEVALVKLAGEEPTKDRSGGKNGDANQQGPAADTKEPPEIETETLGAVPEMSIGLQKLM